MFTKKLLYFAILAFFSLNSSLCAMENELHTNLSVRLQNPFWKDAILKLEKQPEKTKVFLGLSDDELFEIEIFLQSKKEKLVLKGIFDQVLERFAGYDGRASFFPSSPEERQNLMSLLTNQFIDLCPQADYRAIAGRMTEMTERTVSQVSSLLRNAVLAKFCLVDIVEAIFSVSGPITRLDKMYRLNDDDRERILFLLTDDFFEFCKDFSCLNETIGLLYDSPAGVGSFVVTFLQNGFSHFWIRQMLIYGRFNIDLTVSPPKRRDLIPTEMPYSLRKLTIDEHRQALLDFLIRLSTVGVMEQKDVEEILVFLTPPLFGDEKYYQNIAKDVMNFLDQDLLKVLENKENTIRFIRLIYGEPSSYLELRERLIEEIKKLLAFLSLDKLKQYDSAEELLKYIKYLRYDRNEQNFNPAKDKQKPNLLSVATEFQLRNMKDRWYFTE